MLDPTQQRILGVLIEKELAVPDTYPLTENALLAGCNQKSNRDPELSLEAFEVSGALLALQEKEWVVRSERSTGRAIRYRHNLEEKLSLDDREKAVLAELLLRGSQAPGALKSRVARMGLHSNPDEIREVLDGLRNRPSPLVELLPRQPRERDARWAHCLGERGGDPEVPLPRETPPARATPRDETPGREYLIERAQAASSVRPPKVLGERIADLERQVAALREEVRRLAGRLSLEDPDL